MWLVLSVLFFMIVMASAVFGFGWFFASFAWALRIAFWFFLIGGIITLIMYFVNRGKRQPTNPQ
jgi:hypothetical protein